MFKRKQTSQPAGYDKFINWKLFSIPLGLLILLLAIPTPKSMLDVGVEYSMGARYVQDFFSKELFKRDTADLVQWEFHTARLMEESLSKSSFSHSAFINKLKKILKDKDPQVKEKDAEYILAFIEKMPPEKYRELLLKGYDLRTNTLSFHQLKAKEKTEAEEAGFHVKAAVGIILFVVACFLTEAIPLPIVAFCIGIIALLTGIVTRENIAELYWSDATWFIMGSLMFASAFVKTGVDRRLAMLMFGRLKSLNIKWVTLMLIVTIAPLTMFMSDHALAAMFLPIGLLLHSTATASSGREDPELGKMLMITIAMACNLGGSLVPSGAARNIIMINYAEDMFGISIGFAQWCMYLVPMLFLTVPVTWLVINWRFKPGIKDLSSSMVYLNDEISKMGSKWTKAQKVSLGIFLLMLFCWITENTLLYRLTGIRFGVGVLAVMGGVAYIFSGISNWRDYHTRVDWGVVWLYAGAIIFGKILVKTGGAYWMARFIVERVTQWGIGSGLGLLLTGNVITGFITQLMADGPACAAVGPVTLSMAGIVHPGTSMIPFVAMGTSYASSLAYCLVIGTPPNAIVYASGCLEPRDFLRTGIILFITNLVIMMILAATYWQWLGWSGLPSY